MIPDRLAKIIELLKTKTLNKQTIWNKGSGNNQFKLSISDGSAITISKWYENHNDGYEVVVFNNNGDAIERFSTDYDSSESEILLLKSFHKTASDSYFKVEETMDALLASILNQNIIGNKETDFTPPEPEDDDLPF